MENGQFLFDIVSGVAGFFGAWFVKALWEEINKLQKTHKDLAEKINHVEVLVAGEYVKADKFDGVVVKIYEKLDKIYSKLDEKVDK